MTVNVAVAVPFKDTMKSMKHLTEKYGGTLVASQEKNILIILKQKRSNSQTNSLYDTDNK